MKTYLWNRFGFGIVLLASLVGCSARGPIGFSGLPPNSDAPNFTLAALDGKNVSLSDFKGKVVVLNFWATWCSPCSREIPDLNDLYNRYQEKGLAVISIAMDRDGSGVVKSFAEEHKIGYPVLLGDAQIQKSYGGVSGIPSTFLIDKKGKVVTNSVGYQNPEALEKRIQSLL